MSLFRSVPLLRFGGARFPDPARFGPAVAVLATLVLLGLRAPQTFAAPQFWAEDGREFFVGAKLLGFHALVTPYAGYLHLAPRLTALASGPFSATEAPAIFAMASVALTLWSAFTIAQVPLRHAWLYGALLLAAPHTGESFGNITNVQWLLAAGLAVILAAPSPEGLFARRNQVLFAALAGLTGPFSALCLPLVVLRLWRDRDDAHARWLCLLVTATAAIQLAAFARTYAPNHEPVHAVHVARAVLDRWFGQMAHGARTGSLVESILAVAVALAAVPALLAHRRLFLPLALFTASLLAVVLFRFMRERASFDDLIGNDRYLYLPRLVVVWALVTLLLDRRWHALPAAVALGIVLTHYVWWARPDLPVLPWRSEAWRIDHGEAVRIVINPLTGEDANAWTVTLPERP